MHFLTRYLHGHVRHMLDTSCGKWSLHIQRKSVWKKRATADSLNTLLLCHLQQQKTMHTGYAMHIMPPSTNCHSSCKQSLCVCAQKQTSIIYQARSTKIPSFQKLKSVNLGSDRNISTPASSAHPLWPPSITSRSLTRIFSSKSSPQMIFQRFHKCRTKRITIAMLNFTNQPEFNLPWYVLFPPFLKVHNIDIVGKFEKLQSWRADDDINFWREYWIGQKRQHRRRGELKTHVRHLVRSWVGNGAGKRFEIFWFDSDSF